jgi:hypothetical protein
VITLLLLGCTAPPPPSAPAELEDLCPALYADQPDAAALAVDVPALDAWLAGSWDPTVAGYQLPPLTEDDVAGLARPDRPLADALGGAGAAASSHTLAQHIAFVLEPDQSVVNPGDYAKFDRTFLEGGDCFAAGDCDVLRTWNDIVKTAAFGVEIPYAYEKDYRRVRFTDADGDVREAVVSRGWVEEVSLSDDEANGILQSYNLDVFIAPADGDVSGIVRTQAQWAEMKLVIDDFVDDDFLFDQLIDGLQGVFADTDAAIDALGL